MRAASPIVVRSALCLLALVPVTTVASAVVATQAGQLSAEAPRDWDDDKRNRDKKEYLLKAAYLFNFASFVEWPAARFKKSDSPIIFGVVGVDPFGDSLEKTFKGRKVGTRALTVSRFSDAKSLGNCHVLFLPQGHKQDLKKIIAYCQKTNVLLVSESPGFLKQGGIVNFYIEDDSIQFEIHVDRAKRWKLEISSKLLRLARLVKGEDGDQL